MSSLNAWTLHFGVGQSDRSSHTFNPPRLPGKAPQGTAGLQVSFLKELPVGQQIPCPILPPSWVLVLHPQGKRRAKRRKTFPPHFILPQLCIDKSHAHPRPTGCRCNYVTATASPELQCHFLAWNKAGRRRLGTKNHQKDAYVSCPYRSTSAASGAHGSLGTEIRITLLPACLGFQLSFAKHWARLMHTISSVTLFLKQPVSIWAVWQLQGCLQGDSEQHPHPSRKHTGIVAKVWQCWGNCPRGVLPESFTT